MRLKRRYHCLRRPQKREKINELAHIEEEINKLRSDVGGQSSATNLEQLLEERDRILTQEARDNAFRSKCRWKHMGEKGTKYFHSPPKRNVARIIQNEMFVSCPEREGGVKLSSDSSEMLRSCRLYFVGLYQRDDMITGAFNTEMPITLRPDEREFCDKELTQCELKTALMAMKNDTSCVCDCDS